MENWINTFGGFINKLIERKKIIEIDSQLGDTVKVVTYYEDIPNTEQSINICKYELARFLELELEDRHGDICLVEIVGSDNPYERYDERVVYTILDEVIFYEEDVLDYLNHFKLL
jgi:ATP-dependent RNA circularization protein (DNA/RNA ligase family)